jgi:hypothetical protein
MGSLADGAQPANTIKASGRNDSYRRRMRKPPRWGPWRKTTRNVAQREACRGSM